MARRIMRRCCYNVNDDEEECGCFPLTGEFECNTDDVYRVVQVREEGLPPHYRFFPAGRSPQTTDDRRDLLFNFCIFLAAYLGALHVLTSFNSGQVKLIYMLSGPFVFVAAGFFMWDSAFSRHPERWRQTVVYVCISAAVAISWIGLYALAVSS